MTNLSIGNKQRNSNAAIGVYPIYSIENLFVYQTHFNPNAMHLFPDEISPPFSVDSQYTICIIRNFNIYKIKILKKFPQFLCIVSLKRHIRICFLYKNNTNIEYFPVFILLLKMIR